MLGNLLLDGHTATPVLKISGFAYSKAPDLDSGRSLAHCLFVTLSLLHHVLLGPVVTELKHLPTACPSSMGSVETVTKRKISYSGHDYEVGRDPGCLVLSPR